MRNLIALSGRAGSGKDTVGAIIQYLTSEKDDRLSFEEWKKLALNNSYWANKKFAGKLKTIAALLSGVNIENFEDQEFKKQRMTADWGMTYREFLQRLGTEAMREGLHEEVWVNALFADYVPISDISKSNTYVDDRLQHGYKGTRIWSTYHNIKQRCNNVKHPRYNDYGGRGITMCEEWLNDVTSFINWAIQNGYNKGLTIDRIDNNKGYSPDNCRCVSYAVQATNTSLRKNNTTGYKGVSIDKKNGNRIRANIQIKGKVKFLGYYDTFEEASEVYELAFLEREKLYLEEEKSNLVYPSWCITDMRFPNELEAVKERNGITIRVVREHDIKIQHSGDPDDFHIEKFDSTNPKHVALKLAQSLNLHPSETALDDAEFDYIIENDGSMEELIQKVRDILIKEEVL